MNILARVLDYLAGHTPEPKPSFVVINPDPDDTPRVVAWMCADGRAKCYRLGDADDLWTLRECATALRGIADSIDEGTV